MSFDMKTGIVDKLNNPFGFPSWIKQGYGLTFGTKRNRQDKLPALFDRSVEEINSIDNNIGRYVAFVAIRWGFAELKENVLVPTERWENRSNYDEFGQVASEV